MAETEQHLETESLATEEKGLVLRRILQTAHQIPYPRQQQMGPSFPGLGATSPHSRGVGGEVGRNVISLEAELWQSISHFHLQPIIILYKINEA